MLTTHADRLFTDTVPLQLARPQAHWTADHYRAILTALAGLHAAWWGRPPDYPWLDPLLGHHSDRLLRQSRAALIEIEQAPWGHKFFTPKQMRAWLAALDDPACLLDILGQMPQTLIHGDYGDYWPSNTASHAGGLPSFDGQTIAIGPAPYDLACLCLSSRWWFGRTPLSMVEMRNHYLQHLNERLNRPVDRYLFDAGIDAARAWHFAAFWPAAIREHHTTLLAGLHHLQNTVIEPASASLRRCAN